LARCRIGPSRERAPGWGLRRRTDRRGISREWRRLGYRQCVTAEEVAPAALARQVDGLAIGHHDLACPPPSAKLPAVVGWTPRP
jgi:hypothetical protein